MNKKSSFTTLNNKRLAYTFIIVLILTSVLITFIDHDAAYTAEIQRAVWVSVLTIGVIGMFSGAVQTRNEVIVISFAWLIRVAFVTINNVIPIFRGDPFYDMAYALYYDHPQSIIGSNYPIITNFPPVIQKLMTVTGPNRMLLCYFNCFLSMVMLLFVLKTLRLLEINDKPITIVLLLLSIDLPFLLYGAEIFREALELPFVAISFYFLVKWLKRNQRLRYAVLALLFTLPAVYLHTPNAAISLAFCIIFLFYRGRMTSNRRIYKVVLLLGGIGAALFLFRSILNGGVFSSSQLTGVISNLSGYFKNIQDDSITGFARSRYLGWMQFPTSIGAMILYTLLRIFYFLFSPLIWDVDSFGMLLIFFLDAVIFIIAAVSFVRIMAWKRRRRGVAEAISLYKNYKPIIWSILLIVLIVSIPYSWGTIAAGTAMRHRSYFLPMVAVMIAIGMQVNGKKGSNMELR